MKKKELLEKTEKIGAFCDSTISQLDIISSHLKSARKELKSLNEEEESLPDEIGETSEEMDEIADLLEDIGDYMADLKREVGKAEETAETLSLTIEDVTQYYN